MCMRCFCRDTDYRKFANRRGKYTSIWNKQKKKELQTLPGQSSKLMHGNKETEIWIFAKSHLLRSSLKSLVIPESTVCNVCKLRSFKNRDVEGKINVDDKLFQRLV